jgi:TolB-like protein
MSSIIEGYSYDIFISYRQKDNKGDRWVSEFVDALKTELESTFKEEISVYFDINPHDGLLETHDVDESLKEKLKCLVFIPIISCTYCDPNSFAWEHEFKAFVNLASNDQFGLKVRLPNGNVANRVMPVRIYNLDSSDIKLCESVLGGVMRGIDFIYSEPGVNRPLKSDDDEKYNLNKTRFRNQINKVSNSIKEIISGLKNEPIESSPEKKETLLIEDKPLIKEKSIIVLPFENISPDPDQEYFSDGLTEEIITDLSQIDDLLVISRSSAMTFKGTKKTIPEIAKAVNVRYVLEGSVRKAGDNLRITAQLIDSITDAHMWAEKYTSVLDNVFDIQEKVSKSIMDALKLKFSFQDKEKITIKPTRNIQVYECYLKAKSNIYLVTKESLNRALQLLQFGLEILGENALLYATLGEAKYMYYDAGIDISENILDEVAKLAQKALALEPKIAQGHKLFGLLERGRGSLTEGYKHMKRAYTTDPNDPTILMYTSLFTGIYCGRHSLAEPLYNRLIEIDPLSAVNYLFLGNDQYFQGNFKKAVELLKKTSALNPEFFYSDFWLITILAANNQKQESFDLVDRILKDENIPATFKELTLFIKYVFLGERELALKALSDETKEYTWKDPDFTVMMPGYYSLIHEKGIALKYLDHAVNRGFINYPWLSEIDPFLENIRGEERFKKLMERVKYEWENFEV